MCSRYFLDADGNVIAYTFSVAADDRLRKRFNIAPTQEAPIVRAAKDGGRELAMARWGLVPYWAKDLAVGTKMINARCEGVETKPAFRAAVEKRRCIVPATGFFEWKGVARHKQPFAITLPDRHVFGFAGLWERWKPEGGEPVETFTIVTTDASEAVAQIHDRMPVILPRHAEDRWLHGDPVEACKLLTPYSGVVNLRAVSRHVSNVKNEGPECLDDAESSWGSQQSLL
ncbi:MAG: SOS response-associated peptidase [Burkholderiales bacterium]|nr:SOS response-associated peptidase [Burkholderiales bacterium]